MPATWPWPGQGLSSSMARARFSRNGSRSLPAGGDRRPWRSPVVRTGTTRPAGGRSITCSCRRRRLGGRGQPIDAGGAAGRVQSRGGRDTRPWQAPPQSCEVLGAPAPGLTLPPSFGACSQPGDGGLDAALRTRQPDTLPICSLPTGRGTIARPAPPRDGVVRTAAIAGTHDHCQNPYRNDSRLAEPSYRNICGQSPSRPWPEARRRRWA